MKLTEQISWCKDQIKNGYEVVVIRSILQRLENLQKKEPPSEYHNKAIEVYRAFLNSYNLPFVMDARQGKALKEVLLKLKAISKEKTEESAFESFIVILKNWQRVGDFHGKIKTVSNINNNLVEIIDKIKNGATKKQSRINEAEQFNNELMQ